MKMKEDKKPDNVVFDTKTQKYDAALKPYATSVGAPVITTTDTIAWKNRSIHKINRKVEAKYVELKAEYDEMMREFEYNKLIFNAKFNFEPIIGEVYHLYKRGNGESFLSIIAPEECNFHVLGSFYLNTEQIWEKI
jgi:predicted nucleotide-binding protein (sugar kinase/HSP70/actin superfamily)